MNPISNIWNHPKTSVAGLLIAVVAIARVLSQQGLTLGSAGSGTVVTLVGAIATALLGLLARDPSNQAVILSESVAADESKACRSLRREPAVQLHRQARRLGADRTATAVAVYGRLLRHDRCAGHRQLDAGAGKRRGDRRLNRRVAGAGGCANLCGGHVWL